VWSPGALAAPLGDVRAGRRAGGEVARRRWGGAMAPSRGPQAGSCWEIAIAGHGRLRHRLNFLRLVFKNAGYFLEHSIVQTPSRA